MRQPPDLDPYEVLGVDASADRETIDRAYKARIRFVHPDIAGIAGLDEAKRLNLAREWLLDAELRARLPRPRATWWRARRAEAPPRPPAPPPESPRWEATRPRRPSWTYDPLEDDALAFDYGTRTAEIRTFFGAIRTLTSDERARLTYSLGDEPPISFDDLRRQLDERLQARSMALRDAVWSVWTERADEGPPLLFPRGRVFGNGAVVADAYAQWLLLGEAIRQLVDGPERIAALATRCTWAWDASVGRARYGSRQQDVLAFLDEARAMPVRAAERLARSWDRHMGNYLYGRPGEDWFPGSPDERRAELVSARLAAVDASRIDPPDGLHHRHHNGFRYGLRLTAHVLGLGGADGSGRDYLRPWRDSQDVNPSFWDRARWGMPVG